MKKIVARVKAPVPKFFKKLKVIGLGLAGAGAAVMASPVLLPAVIVSIAGYCVVAGSVIGAISQLTVEGERE